MKKVWLFFYKSVIILIGIGSLLALATMVVGEKQPFYLVGIDRIADRVINMVRQKNFIKNPSFEINRDGNNFPDNWDGANITLSKEEKHNGLLSVQTKNDLTILNNTTLEQTINYLWPKGVALRFSGWAKINDRVRTGNVAGVKIRTFYVNGQTDEYEIFLDSKINEWQPMLIDFFSRQMMKRVVVTGFLNQTGTIYFDDFSLVIAPAVRED